MVLKSRGSRFARGECRAVAAALFSVLLASCTSTTDPTLSVGMAGYNAKPGDIVAASASAQTQDLDSSAPAAPQPLMSAEGSTELPVQVAYLPTSKPDAGFPAVASPDGAQAIGEKLPQALQPQLQTAAQTTEAAAKIAAGDAAATAPKKAETETAAAAPTGESQVYVTAGEMPSQPIAPKKKGFLASLFGATPAQAAPAPQPKTPPKPAQENIANDDEPAKPLITLASASSSQKPLALASVGSGIGSDSLPGVRQTALFEIRRKSGIDDDSDVDLNEDEGGAYQVASAAGLARLAPNGLLKQTEGVDVACLKPSLVRVLKLIEGHYGKKLVVTSGYRNPDRNRRARGAKNSLHMYCAAADVQVPGVGKWELASYLRTMPGRGGVGTYCHTNSVHVDVGPERDWNWRCRRRK